MQDGYRMLSGFLTAQETADWLRQIDERRHLFAAVASKAGMNLPYNVLSGTAIREHFPQLFALAAERLLAVTQEIVGARLEFLHDPQRAVRIQCYRALNEGFKWHLDGGKYSALLTFVNTNRGATEIVSTTLSRRVPFLPYVLFPLQRLFEVVKPLPLVAEAGDLLILRGGDVIHRGTTRLDTGERLVLVATFNPYGTRPTPLWDTFARWLNY